MAKDNLFLGFGRGKVGDVVFYRRDGQQITRARNRAPRNPNTFRQQVQRSVSANCQRLYSAGMQVFNHSFEGLKVGEGCQREFLRLNMKKLRSLVINDYNLGRADADCIGRVGAPGLTIPVPFDGMVISNGSVQQSVFSFDSTDGFCLPDPLRDQNDQIIETIGAYCLRVGLVPEDIYTFVAFGCDPLEGTELAYYGDISNYTPYAAIYTSLFAYSQLRVKAGVTEDETMITSGTNLADVFEAGEVGTDITSGGLTNFIKPQLIDARMVDGLIGCIRSREDSGVRSPSMLRKMASGNSFGLTANYLEKAWGERARIAGSDLILEGSDFAPSEGGGGGSAVILAIEPTVSEDVPITIQPGDFQQFMIFGNNLSWDTFDRLSVVVDDVSRTLQVDKSSSDPGEWYAYYNQGNVHMLGSYTNEHLLTVTVNQVTVAVTVSGISLT